MRDHVAAHLRGAVAVACFVTAGLCFIASAHASQGLASYYKSGNHKTACGWTFNPNAMTAAHRTLKCGTKVKVTSPETGKSVIVTINDRGPFIRGRVIDLTIGAARIIDMVRAGVIPISVEVLGE